MKKLETNHKGGLRLNWDDLRYMENSFFETTQTIVKAIGNNELKYIVFGCTNKRWRDWGYVAPDGTSTAGIDFVLSEGVIAINGNMYRFAGFAKTDIPGSSKIWFAIDTIAHPDGVKTDKTYQNEHQTYIEYYVKIEYGADYPVGTDGEDYFSLQKDAVENEPDIHTMYEILQENLQKKTQELSVEGLNGCNTTHTKVSVCGNIMNVTGHVIIDSTPAVKDMGIAELPHLLPGTSRHNFICRYLNSTGTHSGYVPCYIYGNTIYVEKNDNTGPNYKIYIGETVVIR